LLDSLHEFKLGLERPHRDLIVKVPRRMLEARIARPDLMCAAVLEHDHSLAQLIAAYVAAAFNTADQISPMIAEMFASHVMDLLAQFLLDRERAQPVISRVSSAATFIRANRLIGLRFQDPDLTPDRIARELGTSTRTLHRMFAEHKTTVMKHLIGERVGRAAELLNSPQARHRTITDIAFACGFNDLSHFARAFEARMGVTPSQWRNSH